MNLLEIQDQLKSLPSDPRTMQALMSYANGANPAVPPYLALGELNRRKQLMEKAQMAQAGQPPQGTVKDQVEQQAGIMALQQGQQQQAMQNAVRMGATGGMGVPAGIPQPAAQPVQAAGGGLMSLLMERAKAKRMNSGGIISFSEGTKDKTVGSASDVLRGAIDAAEARAASLEEDEDETDARRQFRRLQAEADAIRSAPVPKPISPIEQEQELMKKYPERFAALQKEIGADAMSRLDEVQAARRAELEKQKQEAASTKPGILQLLGQSALESRGQYGRSALASILGGYSKLQSGAEAAAIKQEQDLRMKDLEMQDARRQIMDKIDEAKRAKAEGDIEKETRALQDAARIAKEYKVADINLLRGQLTSAGNVLGREISGEARVEAAEVAATRAAARGQGGPYVRSTKTDQSGNVIAIMSDGSTRPLGIKTGDYNARLAKIIGDMEKLEPKFGKLPEEEKRRRATIRLSGEAPAAAPAPAASSPSAAAPAGAKIMTQADVAMTAKKSGKTEEEVRQAAKAAGYTIQ